MKIVNLSHRPKGICRQLVNFAVDQVGARDCIEAVVLCDIANTHGYCSEGNDRHLIVVTTDRTHVYPLVYQTPGYKTAPRYTMADWREHVISTTAHEAIHSLEMSNGLRASELRAERGAVAVLKAWRARQ